MSVVNHCLIFRRVITETARSLWRGDLAGWAARTIEIVDEQDALAADGVAADVEVIRRVGASSCVAL